MEHARNRFVLPPPPSIHALEVLSLDVTVLGDRTLEEVRPGEPGLDCQVDNTVSCSLVLYRQCMGLQARDTWV